MAVIVGVPNDDGVSPYLKCRVTQNINDEAITVTGYLTESCDIELRSVWESPFGQDTLGDVGKVAKSANIGQNMTENTTRTQWNSEQTWEGTEPPEITIQLKFIAYTDAYQEVNLPIMYLMQMASPELLEMLPIDIDVDVSQRTASAKMGRIPSAAQFDFGRKTSLAMRISSVSYDLNAPKTPDGYFAYNTVTITAAPKQMFNRSEIPTYFS